MNQRSFLYNGTMLQSEIITYRIHRKAVNVQKVTCERWMDFEFVSPRMTDAAFEALSSVYRREMVEKYPWYFGTLYLYRMPEELSASGRPLTLASAKKLLEKDPYSTEARWLLHTLKDRNCLSVIRGQRPLKHSAVPYTEQTGFLSDLDAKLAVNSSFFTFDLLDCDSPYDVFGVPYGLMVKGGRILNPPLYDREALLVHRDGRITVRKTGLQDIRINVPGTLYTRPQWRKTPYHHLHDIVVIGSTVVDVRYGGNTPVPSAGYIISSPHTGLRPGDPVEYSGLEDVVFGIQAGPASVIDGAPVPSFLSAYYSPFLPFRAPFPPARYPLDYGKAAAPRIVLGADAEMRPVLVWVEGRKHPESETESQGISLLDLGYLLKDLGLVQAVNLDGGGSAQILLDGRRALRVSGESERPVPAGLMIR